MGVPCVSGDFLTRMLEALEFSETNRVELHRILEEETREAGYELLQRHTAASMRPPTQREIEIAGEVRARQKREFRNADGADRLGQSLATAYGIAELLYTQRHVARTLDGIFEALLRLAPEPPAPPVAPRD